jgi:hypothetical protein
MKNIDRREFLSGLALAGAGLASIGPVQVLANNQSQKITRIGIIGLDTSQVTMIISHINNIPGPGYDVVQPLWDSSFEGFRVTAAYPYGSKKIESSIKQIPTYVGKMKENGVELVDSIKTLLKKVDAVMLMTFDGHPRVEQAMEVIKAGKPYVHQQTFRSLTKRCY